MLVEHPLETQNDSVQTGSGTTAPRVSVIMPAYNVAEYIADALASVFAQTYRNYEIVVVNDGSPDTPELERVLAPHLSRINYIKQENQGLPGARNTAIRAARGEVIALLDPDDLWEPNYLAVQVAALDADSTLDVVYPNAVFFGETPLAGRRYMDVMPSYGPVTFEKLCYKDCSVFICVMARRAVLLQMGLFDETLRASEDLDMWLRLLHKGGRIGYHKQVLARYRRREGQITANEVNFATNKSVCVARLQQKLGELPPPRERALARLREETDAYLHLYKSKDALRRGDPAAAQAELRIANEYFQSWRKSLTVALLGVIPNTLRRLFLWRAH